MKEGDIVLAPFGFEESENKKLRPCLVWDINPLAVTLVYISSQKLAKAFDTEVVLSSEEARSIGLLKASRIEFGKRDRCLVKDIGRTLGNIGSLRRAKLMECFRAAKAANLLD